MCCPSCEHDNRPDWPGDPLEIVRKSFGSPFAGELVVSSVHEIASARRDARAADVVVDPPEHYKVRRL